MHAAGGAAAAEQAVIDSQDGVLEGCKGPQAVVVHSRSGLTAHYEKAEEAVNSELFFSCNAVRETS